MLENMIIMGNTSFVDAMYSDGRISLTNNQSAFEFSKCYNVDNLSKKYLTIDESLKYLNVFGKNRKYSYAVVSLGEGDLLLNTKVDDFKNKFDKLMHKLAKLKLKVILADPFLDHIEKYDTAKYKNAINELYKKYDKDYISVLEDEKEIEIQKEESSICFN